METNEDEIELIRKIAQRQQLREQIQRIQAEKFHAWKNEDATSDTDTKVISMPVKRTNYWRIGGVSVAASVILLIGFLSVSDVSYTPVSAMAERSNTTTAPDANLKRLDEGIMLLQNQKSTEAIAVFNEVKAMPDIRPYYQDVATWYKVVALLKSGNKTEAKALLSQIESTPDFRYSVPLLDKWKVKWKLLF